MTNLDLHEIQPLDDFQRNVKDHIRRVKKSQRPLVLTVKGRPAVIVQDAQSYQAMLDVLDEAEAIVAIERGLQESRQGKGLLAQAFMEKMRKKYKVNVEE